MRREDNKNTVFADIMTSLSKYFIAIVAIMILVIAFSGVKFVKSGNVALILRFGNLVGDTYEEQVHEPGLLLAFPYIIDEVVMVPTGSIIEQKVTTHYTEGYMQDVKTNGYVITGDQNIAVINATVKYKITDPVAKGIGIGSASHAIGTARAMEMGEIEGAMSGLSIAVSGVLTVFAAALFANFY
jgi:regulator of protease activity HflC (stomatin/prohibitin superfamily)